MRKVLIVCDRCKQEKKQDSGEIRGYMPLEKMTGEYKHQDFILDVNFSSDLDFCADCFKWFVQNCKWSCG